MPQWLVADYEEGFQQETVPFQYKLKRAEFLAEWRRRFPRRPKYYPNPTQRRVLTHLGARPPARAFLFYWTLGSGKTLAALWYAALFRFERVLVVCSKTMVAQWLETLRLARCLVPGTLVVIITYDKLEMLASDLEVFPPFDVAVLDECHYYKNLNDAKTQSFQVLQHMIPRLVLLSGTPLRHSVEELEMYSRLFGGPQSQQPWAERVTSGQTNSFYPHVSYYNGAPKPSEAWFYPKVETTVVEYPLEPLHNLAYLCKAGRNHKLDLAGGGRVPTWGRGDELSRNALLNQCVPFEGAPRKLSAKLSALLERVHASPCPQVVYSMYKHFHAELLAALGQYRVRTLTGAETPAEREKARTAFLAHEVDVLILCRVGCDGLDLYTARTLHVLEPQTNDAETRQVVGRVVRGSLVPYAHSVGVYHYCCTLALTVTVTIEQFPLCRQFCEHYSEVGAFVLAWGRELALSADVLTRFLRAANAAEGGTVEEKRARRSAAGTLQLQVGLQYLQQADLFSAPGTDVRA